MNIIIKPLNGERAPMKTPLLMSILTAAIVIIPGISSANSDDSQYPAASFQPKILFQSEEASSATSSSSAMGEKAAYDSNYPASSFEPKVLYQLKFPNY